MKLVTFELDNKSRLGAVSGENIVPLDAVAPTMLALIDAGKLAEAQHIAALARETISLDRVRLLAPIPRPRKNIFALGRNYGEHAKESAGARGAAISPPVVFTKAPTTVNAPFGDIVIDPDVSVQIDWEVELGVVIGKRARKVRQADALDYVFGYTIINDVTARDLQDRTSQFFIGKSVDGYCPMGPWIVTADEIPDPQTLSLRCRVNNLVKQDGHTRDMIYSVAFTIAELSRTLTLEPGDIITTGTPAGVGFARKPPEFLKPGDVLESEIEHIGVIRNRVIGV
ncbi:MAG: fumarylacetoacetate hydrolase family protein [Chloroflexi bacterium]|nr:fumarylacetoacetate hydrolase family protein [Chloroflexota bacterium]